MENAMEGGHWCNICSKMVNPNIEAENQCPICGTQFVEVMGSLRDHNVSIDLRSALVFSLYAPFFLGLMSGAFSPSLASIASQEYSSSSSSSSSRGEEEVEPEREHELVIRRRTRTSISLMQFFRRLRVRMVSESENSENNGNVDSSIIVIDPFNEEAFILRGPNLNHTRSPSENPVGTLGDFLMGPGFDLLLRHLAQNDPNRYVNVNPPAQKAAIEAMPSVTLEENLQCTVCLEDLEFGTEAKEMPCKHKFHRECILSWLKLHSSCPVCRFQMPFDDSNTETNSESRNQGNHNSDQIRARERMRHGRRNLIPILQPFDNYLPSP